MGLNGESRRWELTLISNFDNDFVTKDRNPNELTKDFEIYEYVIYPHLPNWTGRLEYVVTVIILYVIRCN